MAPFYTKHNMQTDHENKAMGTAPESKSVQRRKKLQEEQDKAAAPRKKRFAFPSLGRVVEATSLREAQAIINKED